MLSLGVDSFAKGASEVYQNLKYSNILSSERKIRGAYLLRSKAIVDQIPTSVAECLQIMFPCRKIFSDFRSSILCKPFIAQKLLSSRPVPPTHYRDLFNEFFILFAYLLLGRPPKRCRIGG